MKAKNYIVGIIIFGLLITFSPVHAETVHMNAGNTTHSFPKDGQTSVYPHNAIVMDVVEYTWAGADYTDIQTSDDNRGTTAGAGGNYPGIRFNFTLPSAEFNWIYFGYEGQHTSAAGVWGLFIWNDTASAWENKLEQKCQASDCSIGFNTTSSISDYVNSNDQIHFMALCNATTTVQWDYAYINYSTNEIPKVSNLIYPAVTEYSPGGVVQHNATVCDADGTDDLDYVTFVFDALGRNVSTNETINSTCAEFYYDMTDWPAKNYTGSSWLAYDDLGQLDIEGSYGFEINKTIYTPNLYIDHEASNKTITWEDTANITGNETDDGDSDVTYSLFRNDALLGSGTPTSNATQLANNTYKFTYNGTEGQNCTITGVDYYLFVTKVWNETSNVNANQEYDYDLNTAGTPIITYYVSHSAINSTYTIDGTLWVSYNVSVNNTNNDTGLTQTFSSAYVNFTDHVNTSVWNNQTDIDNTYGSLSHNDMQYFEVNVTNTTAYETDWELVQIGGAITKYEYNGDVAVIEDEITKTLNTTYTIPISRLDEWSSRETDQDTYKVDGLSEPSGTSLSFDASNVYIEVTTEFSGDLDEGDHTFEIDYYISTAGDNPPGGGGGGGGDAACPTGYYEGEDGRCFKAGNVSVLIDVSPREYQINKLFPGEYNVEISLTNLGSDTGYITIHPIDNEELVTQWEADLTDGVMVIEPGNSTTAKIYLLIEEEGEYTINFVARDTTFGDVQTFLIKVNVAGDFWQRYIDKFKYPLIFDKNADGFSVGYDGIVIKAIGTAYIPIGWAIFVTGLSLIYWLVKAVIKIDDNSKKTLLSLIIAIIIACGLWAVW